MSISQSVFHLTISWFLKSFNKGFWWKTFWNIRILGFWTLQRVSRDCKSGTFKKKKKKKPAYTDLSEGYSNFFFFSAMVLVLQRFLSYTSNLLALSFLILLLLQVDLNTLSINIYFFHSIYQLRVWFSFFFIWRQFPLSGLCFIFIILSHTMLLNHIDFFIFCALLTVLSLSLYRIKF